MRVYVRIVNIGDARKERNPPDFIRFGAQVTEVGMKVKELRPLDNPKVL